MLTAGLSVMVWEANLAFKKVALAALVLEHFLNVLLWEELRRDVLAALDSFKQLPLMLQKYINAASMSW